MPSRKWRHQDSWQDAVVVAAAVAGSARGVRRVLDSVLRDRGARAREEPAGRGVRRAGVLSAEYSESPGKTHSDIDWAWRLCRPSASKALLPNSSYSVLTGGRAAQVQIWRLVAAFVAAALAACSPGTRRGRPNRPTMWSSTAGTSRGRRGSRSGRAHGQVGRAGIAGPPFGRPLIRRPGLDRHREQGCDRRARPRVLPPHLEALRSPGGLEVAGARGVRQPRSGHASH